MTFEWIHAIPWHCMHYKKSIFEQNIKTYFKTFFPRLELTHPYTHNL